MNVRTIFTLLFVGIGTQFSTVQAESKNESPVLAEPVQNGIWLQPAQDTPAQPIWGFKDGIRVGIAPVTSPRGLISIHTPYLNVSDLRFVNYIALEPITKADNARGFSELEWSKLDNVQGKHFWSGNSSSGPANPDQYYPAHGVISKENGLETLTLYVFSEKFDNGSDVYVRIKFTEGKPYEFEITPYITGDSEALDRYILTATMGNQTRLRTLYLANGNTIYSGDIWPNHKNHDFTDHFLVPASNMVKDKNGGVWFIAAPDEEDTSKATYSDAISSFWRYPGKKATQYWYCANPSKDFKGVVNGRYTYYTSKNQIPGGIAYENFETTEPFEAGKSYVFGITPLTPEDLIDQITK
jgi:hypothetical protein